MTGAPAQRHRLALLALLARAPRHVLAREQVMGFLWPELTTASARQLLNASVHELRKALGDAALVTEGTVLRLAVEQIRIDTIEFEAAAARGDLEPAADLYTGSFLEGLAVPDAVAFDQWCDSERDRLERAFQVTLEQLALRSSQGGEHIRAIHWWRQRLARTPGDGRIVLRLMESLGQAGDRAGALTVAETHAALLAEEFEAERDPTVEAFAAQLRRGDIQMSRQTSAGPFPAGSQHDHHEVEETTAAATPKKADAAADLTGDSFAPTSISPERSPLERLRRALRLSANRMSQRPAIIIAVAALLTIAVLLVVRPGYRGATDPGETLTFGPEPTRIAVFPFRIHGGLEAADLGEGMMDLLSQAVDGLGELRRVDPLAVMSRLRARDDSTGTNIDVQRGRAISEELGAGRFIIGRIFEFGDTARISASLYDLDTAEPQSTGAVEGLMTRLPRLTEELARQLLLQIPLGSGGHLEQIGTIRSANHEALRFFLKAEILFRRGVFDSAGTMLQLAVEEDSSFALAWHRRALVAGWGASGPAEVFAARALQFVDSLRPVDRLLAEASHAFYIFGDGVRAEAAAKRAVDNFPDNAEAWFWLASVRLHYRWQLGTTLGELREATDRVLALDSMFQPAVSMATDQAITQRRYDDARLLLPHAPTGGPGFGVARLGDRGVMAHVAGNEGERQRFWHELESVPALWVWRAADRLLHTDSLDAAERVLHLVVSGDRAGDMVKRSGVVHLAHLPLARGQWRQAREDFERAAELVPEVVAAQAILAALPFYERPRDELLTLRRDLESWSAPSPDEKVATFGADVPNVLYPWIREYALGLLSARLRDSTMAHRYASLLDEASTPADSMGLRSDLARDVRALLALEQSRPAEALRLLGDRPGRASYGETFNYPLARRPIGRFLRAEALYQLQLYDQAIRWFSTFERQLLTTEYVLFAPVYFRSAAIHEALGNPESAREYYQRFVDRWSKADIEYQSLVAQARDRLAALTKSGSR